MDRRDFLKKGFLTTSGAGISSLMSTTLITEKKALAGTNVFKTSGSPSQWSNWSQNIQFTPKKAIEVRNEQEIIPLVLAPKNTSIRVAGSGHSFNSIVPGDVLLSLRKLNEIKIDQKNMIVTVGAGATLNEVITELNKLNLALPTTGEIDRQTIAGIISTGTKGTSIQHGSFSDSDCLLGIRFIDGHGKIHDYDFENANETDKNVIAALRLSLGALGVITAVKLRIVPRFNLKEEIILTDIESALKPENYLTNYRYGFHYFPFSEVAKTYRHNITQEAADVEGRSSRKMKTKYLENILAQFLLSAGSMHPSFLPAMSKRFVSTYKNESYVDNWSDVMIKERTMRFYEMHYSIPIQNAKLALNACRDLSKTFANQGVYYTDLPFHVRFTRAEKGIFLSPLGGDGLYVHIDVNAFVCQKNYVLFFKALENEFLKLNGRPHWGKMFYNNPMTLYPDLTQFKEVSQRLDPKGKFQNQFVKKYIHGV